MAIDWSAHDEFTENTCYCRCGVVFRSHSKFVIEPSPSLVTRRKCPGCGKDDDLFRSTSDPETMTIKR